MILININDHPTNRKKKVFFYKNAEHADYFEKLLETHRIGFEKQVDEEGDQTIYFGVKSTDFTRVKKLNYLTIGHFRKPFIPDRIFRYILIGVSLFILFMAILGAILST